MTYPQQEALISHAGDISAPTRPELAEKHRDIRDNIRHLQDSSSELELEHTPIQDWQAPLSSIEKRPRLIHDERGLSTVEYVILLVMLVVGAIGVWRNLGDNVKAGLAAAESQSEDLTR
ncbi:MAG: hypothetical protein MK135_03240 [Polyangiaceae bacterium]|nr:hypothetical protein [Polyangiaceae bacterium]